MSIPSLDPKPNFDGIDPNGDPKEVAEAIGAQNPGPENETAHEHAMRMMHLFSLFDEHVLRQYEKPLPRVSEAVDLTEKRSPQHSK